MKKIALTIEQRIAIREIMPDRGSYERSVAIQSINRKLDLSVEEIDFYGFMEVQPGAFRWDSTKERMIEFVGEFGDIETLVIAGALQAASEKEILRPSLIPVYEAFCLNKQLEVVE